MHLFSFSFNWIMKRCGRIKIRIWVFNIFNSCYWSLIVIGQASHDSRLTSNKNITKNKFFACRRKGTSPRVLSSLSWWMAWFSFPSISFTTTHITLTLWWVHYFIPFLIETIFQTFSWVHSKCLNVMLSWLLIQNCLPCGMWRAQSSVPWCCKDGENLTLNWINQNGSRDDKFRKSQQGHLYCTLIDR